MCDTEFLCTTQDSSGTPHNIPITQEEYEQDGMCSRCADYVWTELITKDGHQWYHKS